MSRPAAFIESIQIPVDLEGHPAARRLLDWWSNACGDGSGRPLKRAFDPVSFAPLLGAFILVERDAHGGLRLRIKGERIFATYTVPGMDDPTDVRELKPLPYRELVTRDYGQAMAADGPLGWRVTLSVPHQPVVSYRRLTLPMENAPGAADLLLVFNPDALEPGFRRLTSQVFGAFIAAYESDSKAL
ncbi:MAG: PAS domain-containing protein [Alphaproteobacteria bacterium]|nr:PAS domain-containing protein [Alphaproteobacteria bacterium]